MSIEKLEMFKTPDGKLHPTLAEADAHDARLALDNLVQVHRLTDIEELTAWMFQNAETVMDLLVRGATTSVESAAPENLSSLLTRLLTVHNMNRWNHRLLTELHIRTSGDDDQRIPLNLDILNVAMQKLCNNRKVDCVLAIRTGWVKPSGQRMYVCVLEAYHEGQLLGPSAPLYDCSPAINALVVRALRKHLTS